MNVILNMETIQSNATNKKTLFIIMIQIFMRKTNIKNMNQIQYLDYQI